MVFYLLYCIMSEEVQLSDIEDLQECFVEVQILFVWYKLVEELVSRQEGLCYDIVEGIVYKQYLNEFQYKLELMYLVDIVYIFEVLLFDE